MAEFCRACCERLGFPVFDGPDPILCEGCFGDDEDDGIPTLPDSAFPVIRAAVLRANAPQFYRRCIDCGERAYQMQCDKCAKARP